jgi:PAS domain S-box-containing protein
MSELPTAIRDHMLALTVENRTPAYLLVDHDNRLIEWGGELGDYGIPAPTAGLNVDEQMPFLAGLLPLDTRNLCLPYVRTETGRYADVYLFRAETGTWVLLLDATPAAAKQQNMQQRTYDLTLEVTDLRREGDELYQAKSELEQAVRERTAELARANQQLLDELARRKRVEADLRESEARFRRLADANIIGIMFWHTDGTITEANQAFLDMLGYTRTDLEAGMLRWEQTNHPDNRARDEQAFAQLADYGACAPYERLFVRRDRQVVSLLFGAALLTGSQKQIVCFALDLAKYR